MIQYPRYKRHRFSSFQVIIAGFAAVDLVGALLLMLPIATQQRCVTPFHEALFTSTSALCVTGLVVQDTGSYCCRADGRHRAADRLYSADHRPV